MKKLFLLSAFFLASPLGATTFPTNPEPYATLAARLEEKEKKLTKEAERTLSKETLSSLEEESLEDIFDCVEEANKQCTCRPIRPYRGQRLASHYAELYNCIHNAKIRAMQRVEDAIIQQTTQQ